MATGQVYGDSAIGLGIRQNIVGCNCGVTLGALFSLLKSTVGNHYHLVNRSRATYQWYFCFFFLHLFLTASISSGLVPTAFAILNGGVTEVPRILAANLPLAGNYYLSYLLIQCMHLAASTLFRPLALFKLYQVSRGGWTPREPLTYALLTPFILPIATITFGVTYVCFHCLLRAVARVEAETRGRLCFRAWFGLFWAIYTQQATVMGLFILKFDARHTAHDLGQLTILLLTLFLSIQYHLSLKRLYAPLMRHQEGAILEPVDEDALSHRYTEPFADGDCDSSPDTSTSIERCLHGWAPVIWLPRDPAGISTSLVERVTAGPLAHSPATIQVMEAVVDGMRWSSLPLRTIRTTPS
ncbi:hypothetical protein LTR70_010428 [Exophiala xenobiotica]|uniref:CSC1/OSCA1-like 7TM region domain-containing protein n=1 Tax=Lithohypha guttulata TaxID=1690604 RepID=A0ABR0JTZ0_9EURO|nr:hypothetical protein LTR24_010402 [Lithohypha guttulata]KAK5309284.1 hypothetical protein LTR70_010428 [Exophiala xenobiotica]